MVGRGDRYCLFVENAAQQMHVFSWFRFQKANSEQKSVGVIKDEAVHSILTICCEVCVSISYRTRLTLILKDNS